MKVTFKRFRAIVRYLDFREAHKAFLLVSIVAGLFFVVAVPTFIGIDESHHFTRTYQLAKGEMFSERKDNMGGGYIPENIIKIADLSKDIRKNKTDKSFRTLLKESYNTPLESQNKFYNFPGSAAYNIFSYLPAVIGFMFADLLNLNVGPSVALSRIFMLAFYIFVITVSLIILRDLKIKWLVFTISLLPSSIFLAATVNADSPVIALSILIFSGFIKALSSKRLSRNEVLILLLSAIVLPLVKFNYIFISAIILLIPADKFLGTFTYLNSTKRIVWLKLLVIILAAILSLGWVASASWTADTIRYVGAGPEEGMVKDQMAYLLHNPLRILRIAYNTLFISGSNLNGDYVLNMLGGRLGFNNVTLPVINIVLAALSICVAGILAKSELIKHRKSIIWCVLLSTATIASIFGSLYLSFTDLGHHSVLGIQGRYFLPLLPILMSVLVILVPIGLKIKKSIVHNVFILITGFNLMIASYYYFVVTYFGRGGF